MGIFGLLVDISVKSAKVVLVPKGRASYIAQISYLFYIVIYFNTKSIPRRYFRKVISVIIIKKKLIYTKKIIPKKQINDISIVFVYCITMFLKVEQFFPVESYARSIRKAGGGV